MNKLLPERREISMPELITLGETMASFSPQTSGPLRYISDYKIHIAGAESNVAIGITKLGHSAGFISALGNDEFGHYILNFIRGEGVLCDKVKFDSEHPTGIMFKETSSSETRVFYYRENSAASFLSPQDIDEVYIARAKILHLTGITPILSSSCKEALYTALAYAKKHKLLISFDPNIRKKLWKNKDYRPLIKDILFQSNIILLGLDEAETLFETNKEDEILDILLSKDNIQYVAIKNGAKGAWVATKNKTGFIPPYPCSPVDPIGAGDAFNAAFLSGILEEKDILLCGQMAAIAGALATETHGDVEGLPTKEKLEALLNHKKEIDR